MRKLSVELPVSICKFFTFQNENFLLLHNIKLHINKYARILMKILNREENDVIYVYKQNEILVPRIKYFISHVTNY